MIQYRIYFVFIVLYLFLKRFNFLKLKSPSGSRNRKKFYLPYFPGFQFSQISLRNRGQICLIFTFRVSKPGVGTVFTFWVVKPGKCSLSGFRNPESAHLPGFETQKVIAFSRITPGNRSKIQEKMFGCESNASHFNGKKTRNRSLFIGLLFPCFRSVTRSGIDTDTYHSFISSARS